MQAYPSLAPQTKDDAPRRHPAGRAWPRSDQRRVLVLFGTRPEIIKLAPVLDALDDHGGFETIAVSSSQHKELLRPFVRLFRIKVRHDLRVMRPGQTLNQVCARIQHRLDPILATERPDAVLVQGDTTTALAGALAAFHQRIPVGHVEAGLRTDDPNSPFPEEMHRRLISRLATWHFAATESNRQTLLAEGVANDAIFVTGNPVVDALERIQARPNLSPLVKGLLRRTEGMRRVVVTMHRRENFGRWMAHSLRALRDFAARHSDVAVLFPVHPNPAVTELANAILVGQPRLELLAPLDYLDFINLLANAWLVVSDSGGIQEEVPTLGKPLIVLRANTERPEAVEAGFARLVGDQPERLGDILEQCHAGASWMTALRGQRNPFGDGDTGPRIARALAKVMAVRAREVATT